MKRDLKRALPRTSGTMELKGLDSSVEIWRDVYGIPHLKAQTLNDAFFAQGFVTAQDRLWQMEYDRRRAYGRWAEYAGSVALDDDQMMRRLQIRKSVEADYNAVQEETRLMLDAYASGINAFIASSSSPPAIEYDLVGSQPDPWQPTDCLAVFKVRHILMGTFEAKLWRARLAHQLGPEETARLYPGYEPGYPLIIPPGLDYDGPLVEEVEELIRASDATKWLEGIDTGSNAWALSGNRTASGKPLLAGDAHRALDTPNAYYQNHIACPEFDAAGLSFPGCPGFSHFGHNAHVGWCVTHACADCQDLYFERFNEDDPALYEFKGEWKQAEVCDETIQVRAHEPVKIVTYATHHGPVIRGEPKKGFVIALRYTATAEPNTTADAILQMLKASCAEEMEESMRAWVDPCQNFLSADVQGEIRYLTRGKIPVRHMANAWLPVPGWTGQYEWQGYVPFEELPRFRNPQGGCFVTANNRIVGKDYPHYITLEYSPGFRAKRIADRLADVNHATVEQMAAIHADTISIPGQMYRRLLSQVNPSDEFSARAMQKLLAWDGSMESDQVAATIYSAFRDRLDRLILENLLGPLADEALIEISRVSTSHLRALSTLFTRMAQQNNISLLPPGKGWTSVMLQALAEGLAYLRSRLGDDIESWQWAGVHFTKPEHTLSSSFPQLTSLLDPPSLPVAGDGDTPQHGGWSPLNPFVVTTTSVTRYVFDVANWDNSRWVIPLGASGHPGSQHYADQANIWAAVQLIPMLFDWGRIAKEAESHQTLERQ